MTALAFCAVAAAPPPVFAQEGFEVTLARGTAREVKLPAGQAATVYTAGEIGDIRVADPAVAEVAPLDGESLYLLGIAPGRTTVTVYDTEKSVLGVISAEVGIDVTDLKRSIETNVPEADVLVSTVNGKLRLAGTVKTAQALATVLDLAQQYVGKEKLINALRVTDAQQVMLQVRFIEANRRAGKDLGVSMGARDPGSGEGLYTGAVGRGTRMVKQDRQYTNGITYPNFGTTDSKTSPNFKFPVTGNPAFGTLFTSIMAAGLDIDIFIRAMEEKGLGRSLAEPNLTAMSGETASFLAGGEVPIPVPQGDGTITIEYKEYGVRLTFTPIVLDDGVINLKLAPEVSQLDPQVSYNGVPGFISRKTETTVELRDGQSFAISGLLQAVNQRSSEQIPYVGNLPVLGALFRSQSFAKQETDLVVIVTPRLVRPAAPGDPLPDPLSGSHPANEAEFFLAGMMEIDDDAMAAIRSGKGIDGAFGHILELDAPPSVAAVPAPAPVYKE